MGPPEARRGARESARESARVAARSETCEVSALVFAGGDPPTHRGVVPLGADLVIAADSGLATARALGLHVHLVVGDLDSVDPADLDAAVAAGAAVERHPAAKDATDLELALDAAMARGATSVHVVGVGGGRLDHFFGNVLLLASSRYAAARLDALVGSAHVTVIHDRADLEAAPGALCSLLPLGGPAIGVVTDGLRYPLRGETLAPGSTRGVSNEFLDRRASVSLDAGVLLAVVPTRSERRS